MLWRGFATVVYRGALYYETSRQSGAPGTSLREEWVSHRVGVFSGLLDSVPLMHRKGLRFFAAVAE